MFIDKFFRKVHAEVVDVFLAHMSGICISKPNAHLPKQVWAACCCSSTLLIAHVLDLLQFQILHLSYLHIHSVPRSCVKPLEPSFFAGTAGNRTACVVARWCHAPP